MSDNANAVPASVRADGTVRKERRIRPGYVQKELAPKYTPPSRRRQPSYQEERVQETVVKQEPEAIPAVQCQSLDLLCEDKVAKDRIDKIAIDTQTKPPSQPQSVSNAEDKPFVKPVRKYIPPHLRVPKELLSKSDSEDKSAQTLAKVVAVVADNGTENNDDDDSIDLANALGQMSLRSKLHETSDKKLD
ncbi:hypothetical protein LPJ66_001143 [Kickxella alabastrina]|uniref:Uncharacterized protein n=1 Tax=Kickxella alabastrina TaxID=61397 RepID=A0ACC1IU52_9FUNG|nr:hypothetical protein LPJ66_001143 [Kickxella alabastrina]